MVASGLGYSYVLTKYEYSSAKHKYNIIIIFFRQTFISHVNWYVGVVAIPLHTLQLYIHVIKQ